MKFFKVSYYTRNIYVSVRESFLRMISVRMLLDLSLCSMFTNTPVFQGICSCYYNPISPLQISIKLPRT